MYHVNYTIKQLEANLEIINTSIAQRMNLRVRNAYLCIFHTYSYAFLTLRFISESRTHTALFGGFLTTEFANTILPYFP